MKQWIVVVGGENEEVDAIRQSLADDYRLTIIQIDCLKEKREGTEIPDLLIIGSNCSFLFKEIWDQHLLAHPILCDVPILLVLSGASAEIMNYYFTAEEIDRLDYIRTPIIGYMLRHRVAVQIERQEKLAEIQNLQDNMVLSFAELVECRDVNTGGHIKRTAMYVELLVEALAREGCYADQLTPAYMLDVIRAAPLHDIGKIGINDSTLLKSSPLDEDEYQLMKQHANLGAVAIANIIKRTGRNAFLEIAKDVAQYHHEKWNGKGYPDGLEGEEIPLGARIMAIADVYDALTTRRPYKNAYSHEETVALILRGKGTDFDPTIVEVFEKAHFRFREIRDILVIED